jgi:hypothetical protein
MTLPEITLFMKGHHQCEALFAFVLYFRHNDRSN